MKFPQLVINGKDKERPAALSEIKSDVPTSVNEGMEKVVMYWLFVMEMTSARERLIPLRLSSRVSAMVTELAVVTPPKPSERRTGRVVKSIPPTEVNEGSVIALS